MNKFRERLIELRKEKGLSQAQLSRATKISQAAIGKWETGDRSPTLDCVVILVNFFGCTAGYLIGTED